MRLQSIDYSEHEGTPNEWKLDGLTLGRINLLVGKNATGKTRALNVITGLSRLVSGNVKHKIGNGTFDASFDHDGKPLNYALELRDYKVIRETFAIDGKNYLSRGAGGAGEIFAQKEDKRIEFQTPENDLAAVVRRDSIQHSFLEPLHEWGDSLYRYDFGSPLGQRSLALFAKGGKKTDFDPKDADQVVAIYRNGERDFGEDFKESIRRDMERIGYPLEEIGAASPDSVTVEAPFPAELIGLYVKERDLDGMTEQNNMSQGMFRALSIITQLNYAQMASSPSCILIDDIGEGLDFERSCALIELLMDRAQTTSIQLVMATNDRFVMNKVPLEAWSLLQREGGKCRVRNYANSRDAFEDFKLTGMNNFDFFAVDFINQEQALNE